LHQRVVDGDDVVVDGDSSRDSARGADQDRVADGFSGELDGLDEEDPELVFYQDRPAGPGPRTD